MYVYVYTMYVMYVCMCTYTQQKSISLASGLISPPYKAQSCPTDTAVAVVTVLVQRPWFESVLTMSGDKQTQS